MLCVCVCVLSFSRELQNYISPFRKFIPIPQDDPPTREVCEKPVRARPYATLPSKLLWYFFLCWAPHLSLQQLQSNLEPVQQGEKTKEDHDQDAERGTGTAGATTKKERNTKKRQEGEGGKGTDNEAQKDKKDPTPKSREARASKGKRQGETT